MKKKKHSCEMAESGKFTSKAIDLVYTCKHTEIRYATPRVFITFFCFCFVLEYKICNKKKTYKKKNDNRPTSTSIYPTKKGL